MRTVIAHPAQRVSCVTRDMWPGVFAAVSMLRRTQDVNELRHHKEMLSYRTVHLSPLFQDADDFGISVEEETLTHRNDTYILFFLSHPSLGRRRVCAIARQSDSKFAAIPKQGNDKTIANVLDELSLRWI